MPPQKMNYDITVYDVDSDFCTSENMADGVPVMKFTLNGAKIKNYANRQAQNCAITRYVKDETGTWSAQELGSSQSLHGAIRMERSVSYWMQRIFRRHLPAMR